MSATRDSVVSTMEATEAAFSRALRVTLAAVSYTHLGDVKVLIAPQKEVKKGNPFLREKLCPILAYFVEDGWQSACERCIQILSIEGVGHTMTIHSEDESVIREFALKKPVSRLLVNTPAALGGVGATTGCLLYTSRCV